MADLIGCHLSIAGGVSKAAERAPEIGCTAFQIFTSNPRGWDTPPLAADDIARFRKLTGAKLYPIAHMPYLPNLAAPDPGIHRRSVATLIRELERCEQLGIEWLVTHLGSHLGEGEEAGRERVVRAIDGAHREAASNTMLLLENTAGTRNSLGTTPQNLAAIIGALKKPERVGLCIDTAHAFAAGYDWREKSNPLYAELKASGLDKMVKMLHLNDSKVRFDGHADRHEHLGLGEIGLDGLRAAVNHPLFRKLPLICETPVDAKRDDAENVRIARALRKR